MQFHLFFFYYQLIFITIAYSFNIFNQNNSSVNIELYQCNTNGTILSNTTNSIFNNRMDSCNTSCCTSNSSNTCQVTVQSSSGICLSRLCYIGECYNFSLLANSTRDYKYNNKTTIMNKTHLSDYYIPWTSIVNSTQTKWTSWMDRNRSKIRHTILIILSIASISLTFMTLIVVIKSIRHANMLADRKSYRYTLL
jgi:hypothetical protein